MHVCAIRIIVVCYTRYLGRLVSNLNILSVHGHSTHHPTWHTLATPHDTTITPADTSDMLQLPTHRVTRHACIGVIRALRVCVRGNVYACVQGMEQREKRVPQMSVKPSEVRRGGDIR